MTIARRIFSPLALALPLALAAPPAPLRAAPPPSSETPPAAARRAAASTATNANAIVNAKAGSPAAAEKSRPPASPANSSPPTPPPADPAASGAGAAAADTSTDAAPAKPADATPPVDAPVSETATTPVTSDGLKPGILTAVKAKGPPPVSKTPLPPAPLSPRFQQIRQKISALFDNRNAPPAPPDPLTNPFRPPGNAPAAPAPSASTETAAATPAPANNDLASLQQAVATLRVKGTFQRLKVIYLSITSAQGKEGTYKAGDIINVSVAPPAEPIQVRVRQILLHSVTFALGDAEMTLKF